MNTTEHFNRVKEFMKKAGQVCPESPIVPPEGVRLLRAKLIYEEAMELIDALGFDVVFDLSAAAIQMRFGSKEQTEMEAVFIPHSKGPNLIEIADGCADVSVVTIGTLVACGIEDEELLQEVDENNLQKFDNPICPECRHEMFVWNGSKIYTGYPDEEVFRCCNCSHIKPLSFGGHRQESGKWKKGTSHKPPEIRRVLGTQGALEEDLDGTTPG